MKAPSSVRDLPGSERVLSIALDEDNLSRVLDSVYDAAVEPGGWPCALTELACLFQSHFADLFARTNDWQSFQGIAVGLDRADYEDEFLGRWTNRNVWSQASPASAAGEIKPTWQMVSKREVLRSPIYNEYLQYRDLNEGLRLVLWSGDGWLQDISLIRPWAAGPFLGEEIRVARTLLPHLQRAASTSRQLRGVDALAAFDSLDRAAFLVDATGRTMRFNAAAEALLAGEGGVTMRHQRLEAASPEDTVRLEAAVARAGGLGRGFPTAATVALGPFGPSQLVLSVVPVRDRADRDLPAPRPVLVLANPPRPRHPDLEQQLMANFGLTQAEASLAIGLLAGHPLADLAVARARSINTLRTQLARIMTKTNTRRQSELILVLSQLS